jgi:hypothetical protein
LDTKERVSRKHLRVKAWKQIPNWVAYALTLERENNPVKIIGTDTRVPIIVTSYFGVHQNYPVEGYALTSHTYGSWPKLRVAAWDPQGWDVGTAVWTHILLALGPYTGTLPFCNLVLTIAHANPKWSYMLYQKVDHNGHLLGEFQLLSETQKRAGNFEYLQRVIPDTTH